MGVDMAHEIFVRGGDGVRVGGGTHGEEFKGLGFRYGEASTLSQQVAKGYANI